MYFHAKEAIVKKHPEFLFRHGLKLGSIETIWRLGALGMSQMNLFSSNNLTLALEECMINWEAAKHNGIPKLSRENILWD